MLRPRHLALFCAALLVASVPLMAQVQTGRIIGRVVDEQGEPLPGVTIEARSPQLVGAATSVTDASGTYRLLALAPGTYTVSYTLEGFRPVTREDIVVPLEGTTTLNISMQVGTIEEVVTVVGQSPLIDVRSTAKGATLTRNTFTNLPRGRNFDTLINIVPGVQQETDLLAGISVDGASGAENMFYVDGTETTDPVTGESGQQVAFDFAEEIQFKASGYDAEFGGSVGGTINVITRSGGNEFRGEAIGYFYGSPLEGQRRDILDLDFDNNDLARYYPYETYYGETDDLTFEAGLSLGGYFVKDRLWFYGSVIPRFFGRDRTVDFSLQGLDQVIDYNRDETNWNASAKLTAQPFNSLRMGASFVNNYYQYRGENVTAALSNPATDYDAFGFNYPNLSVSAYADWTVASNSLLSVRGGYWYTNQTDQQIPVQPTPYYAFRAEQPFSYIPLGNEQFGLPAELTKAPGWESFPRTSIMETIQLIDKRYFANADLSYYISLAGEHAWKAGVQYVRRGQDYNNTAQQPIVYLAWDRDLTAYGINYGRGTYGWYGVRANADAGPFGDIYEAYSNRWALYLQDSWTIQDRLTLNFGVRTEYEYLPNYSDDPLFADIERPVEFPFSSKIAPRLGFVYNVFGDSSLKVFGSFGIYHDVMKLYMGANALGGTKWKSAYYTLDDPDWTQIGVNGNFPGTLLTVLDFRPPIFESIDPDMKPFTQREVSFGVETLLRENLALSIRGVNKNVLWAIEDLGVVLPGVGEFYYYSNPGGDFINARYQESRDAGILPANAPDMPKAKRNYWGLNLLVEKRLSNNWFGGISYTLSRLEGNYSGLASSDEDGRNSPNGERYFDMWYLAFDKGLSPIDGPMPSDRPHVIKAYGSYITPFGLTIGTVINAQSGVPVTEEWNVNSPSFYPNNRGNLGRTPFLWFANIYADYTLRLGSRYGVNFSVNVDNVFNVDTAQRIYNLRFRDNISPSDQEIADNAWDVPEGTGLDPRYQMEYSFFPPISARLGIRLFF